ncbi:KTSC domain-containing protein [Iodobacter sp. LRB]|uniref:KTSC domain-containing protein n=1 Tax=unclassified Iodobacter TaxID=235634 RepID=UPI000C0FEB60|nr:KTSC domain-containing protein [Iodobacter sp. BJB302]PHV01527.1 KTSC domain-containing protein [Iodobacter sp. BJB302]
MDLISVSSSNLKAVGYDPASQTLQIAFRNGGRYEYYNVPPAIHAALMAASSKGAYFHARIKNASYRYRKLR